VVRTLPACKDTRYAAERGCGDPGADPLVTVRGFIVIHIPCGKLCGKDEEIGPQPAYCGGGHQIDQKMSKTIINIIFQ